MVSVLTPSQIANTFLTDLLLCFFSPENLFFFKKKKQKQTHKKIWASANHSAKS